MFDKEGNGTVTFDEFIGLWRFLAAWRDLFDQFDEDRSGRISLQEFGKALVAFGYRLSQPFVGVLYTTFESRARGKPSPTGDQLTGMSFDLFVQACITLKRMTEVFKRYDSDRDGYITLSFEEFLGGWLSILFLFLVHFFVGNPSFLPCGISLYRLRSPVSERRNFQIRVHFNSNDITNHAFRD
jgi:Ca2+-binding EF-hand superfamily protein